MDKTSCNSPHFPHISPKFSHVRQAKHRSLNVSIDCHAPTRGRRGPHVRHGDTTSDLRLPGKTAEKRVRCWSDGSGHLRAKKLRNTARIFGVYRLSDHPDDGRHRHRHDAEFETRPDQPGNHTLDRAVLANAADLDQDARPPIGCRGLVSRQRRGWHPAICPA